MLGQLSSHLERYMDLLTRRQQVVATNIANADTPGYRTRDLDFQAEFQKALEEAANLEAPRLHAIGLHEVEALTVKNDGNNVSVQREAQLLGETAVRFNIASNFLRAEIRQTRAAIRGGGGQS